MLVLSSNLADAAGVEGDFSAGQGVLHVRIAQLEENSVFSTLEPQLTDPQGIRKTCSLELDGLCSRGFSQFQLQLPVNQEPSEQQNIQQLPKTSRQH